MPLPEQFRVQSPDGELTVTLSIAESEITYAISRGDVMLVAPSEVTLFPGRALILLDFEESEHVESWTPVWGQFSQCRVPYHQLTLSFSCGSVSFAMECWLANDGFAMRYVLPEGSDEPVHFKTAYRLPANVSLYMPNGEYEPVGPVKLTSTALRNDCKAPLVVEYSDQAYLALMESDLFSAPAFKTLAITCEDGNLSGYSPIDIDQPCYQTPWRVFLVGESPGELVTSMFPDALAGPCRLEDTSWIRPGKSMWDWRVHGFRDSEGFVYGVNTESYRRFIDFAADNNIQYFLMDDHWFSDVTENGLKPDEALDMPFLKKYAAEKGVDLLLYYDQRISNRCSDETVLKAIKEYGGVGIKYGFRGDNAGFTRQAVKLAAEHRMLINFHDNPTPMTGVKRSLPNVITREYCHSQQDRRTAFSPTSFLKMAMVNAVSGPLDQTNGAFDLNAMNAAPRERGALNPYKSTVVGEVARSLIIFTGLLVLPDAPEAYRSKDDLFDFIRRMPAGQWDETRIINDRIGQSITTLRRHDDTWYAGSAINEDGGTLDIPLDFLKPGIDYKITFYEDAPDSHYIKNREKYQIRYAIMNSTQTVTAGPAPGGGHCMLLESIL